MSLDWEPMIRSLLSDLGAATPVAVMSARFHNTLAEMIVAVAERHGVPQVALSGGCFQNRYLTERAVRRLVETGFAPHWHQRVPPNDGGIALGQIMAAARSKE
jgi:hydrogenase maturation protein HypF